MAELPIAAKMRLVALLATFSGPSEAARIVSDEFGVALKKQQAWKYDPTRSGCNISPRLRLLFAEVRERWLNDLAAIPIAHQAQRLRSLSRLATKMEERGDYLGAAKVLEQAAKEVGGVYSHARTGAASASMEMPRGLAEMRAQLAARLEVLGTGGVAA